MAEWLGVVLIEDAEELGDGVALDQWRSDGRYRLTGYFRGTTER